MSGHLWDAEKRNWGYQTYQSEAEYQAALKKKMEALKPMVRDLGLSAAVYTQNEARAAKLLSGLPVGSAYINCCDRVSPRLPWTGRKHSGIGSTLSTLGIQAFVQPKAWHIRRG